MGLKLTYNGRAVEAIRGADETAMRTALAQLDAMGEADSAFQVPEACRDLYEDLLSQAAAIPHSIAVLLEATPPPIDPANEATYIPGESYSQLADWLADPVLAQAVAYAPEGLLTSQYDASQLYEIVNGVSALEQGRCGWRTRWGLVGAVAVLGALVLGGGAYIYSRSKKRGR